MPSWLVTLLEKIAGVLAIFFAGKIQAQKEQAQDDAKQLEIEAQRYADQPATDDDFHDRLRDRINKKREAED